MVVLVVQWLSHPNSTGERGFKSRLGQIFFQNIYPGKKDKNKKNIIHFEGETLDPGHMEKSLGAMTTDERATKRITFKPFCTGAGETLYVHVPKFSENEVLSPFLRFDKFDDTGLQNIPRTGGSVG